MLIPNQTVIIKWSNKNKQHYIAKGYEFTKVGDEFVVNVEDLTFGSHSIVKVKCDYCGKVIEKKFHTYNLQHDEDFGDACRECQPQKNKKVCLRKYGVDNGAKTPQSIEKFKQTSLEKYGVDNPAKTKESREKISQASKDNAIERMSKARTTNLQRYGCEYPSQNAGVMNKQRNTMIERYGVDHPKKSKIILEKEKESNREKYGCDYYWQTTEGKEKIRQTCIEKYGVASPMQNPNVRAKATQTLCKNGTTPTSKQQLMVFDMCKELYGDINVTLNKPMSTLALDVELVYNNCLIDIEYDGAYWHQDSQRDRKRDEFVKAQGYKILRIKANKSIPTKEQLEKAVNKLVNDNYSFTMIELDI